MQTKQFLYFKRNSEQKIIAFTGDKMKPDLICKYLGILTDAKIIFEVQLNFVLSKIATAIRLLNFRIVVFKSIVISQFFLSIGFLQTQKPISKRKNGAPANEYLSY